MTYRHVIPLSLDERYERAKRWPVYIPMIYFACRRAKVQKNRWETVKFSKRWFHAWVWNYTELPWA